VPNFASQMRVAFSSTERNTVSNSPGELEITRSTSEVAVCCSRASASSRVRALTCSCRSARVELAGRASVGASLRLGFVVLACCAFAGLRLIVRRRLTEPFPWADDHTLPHHEVRCAPQQNSLSIGSYGSDPVVWRCLLNVRFAPESRPNASARHVRLVPAAAIAAVRLTIIGGLTPP
jgi:hypothetical protein